MHDEPCKQESRDTQFRQQRSTPLSHDISLSAYNLHVLKLFQGRIDPTELCAKGRALVSQGQVERALDLYTTVIKENPQFSPAYADRGTVYAMMRQHAKAIEDLSHALALGYREGSLFTTLATVQKELGDFSSALRNFDQAEVMNPNDPLIYYNRSGVHLSLGNQNLAILDLNKCLEFGPDETFRAAIAKRLKEAKASS